MGSYLYFDDNTRLQQKMDVARILVRTKYSNILNDVMEVLINNVSFKINIVEDSYEPLRIVLP